MLQKENRVCVLVESFTKAKNLAQNFSVGAELGSERLNRFILEDLKLGRWPTDCILKRKVIKNYVQMVQKQILICKKENLFDFMVSRVFDIRNRVFAIDCVLSESKSVNCDQIGYNDLTLKVDKFILLDQTKPSDLSKLPECKTVIVDIFKIKGSKKPIGMSMPIDKVLQRMFLIFLDVLVEEQLTSSIFAYRKGFDGRMAVANVYFILNRSRYLNHIYLLSSHIINGFDSILHQQILKQYPFPEEYSFLLSRWLTPTIIDKSQKFTCFGRVSRGILLGSVLGPSIANLLFSKVFQKNIFKEKGNGKKKRVWGHAFSYSNDIILIANDRKLFKARLVGLKKKFKKVGISLYHGKAKFVVAIMDRVRFQFLGFEFSLLLRSKLRKSSLFGNMKNLYLIKECSKGFAIILRPCVEKVKAIKKQLKIVIKGILHQPRNRLYRSFQQINSILLGWGSYYYFNHGCIIAKRIDNLVFTFLRKTLIKKFRYIGLLRPKWVAYTFLGLDKVNPNSNAWQPRVSEYVKNSSKIVKRVYIWYCNNIFSRVSITCFILSSKFQKKNYYSFRMGFKKSTGVLFCKRLKSKNRLNFYLQ